VPLLARAKSKCWLLRSSAAGGKRGTSYTGGPPKGGQGNNIIKKKVAKLTCALCAQRDCNLCFWLLQRKGKRGVAQLQGRCAQAREAIVKIRIKPPLLLTDPLLLTEATQLMPPVTSGVTGKGAAHKQGRQKATQRQKVPQLLPGPLAYAAYPSRRPLGGLILTEGS
jgi:hypothetical protein